MHEAIVSDTLEDQLTKPNVLRDFEHFFHFFIFYEHIVVMTVFGDLTCQTIVKASMAVDVGKDRQLYSTRLVVFVVGPEQIEIVVLFANIEHPPRRLGCVDEVANLTRVFIQANALHAKHMDQTVAFWENIETELKSLLFFNRIDFELLVLHNFLADEPIEDSV